MMESTILQRTREQWGGTRGAGHQAAPATCRGGNVWSKKQAQETGETEVWWGRQTQGIPVPGHRVAGGEAQRSDPSANASLYAQEAMVGLKGSGARDGGGGALVAASIWTVVR